MRPCIGIVKWTKIQLTDPQDAGLVARHVGHRVRAVNLNLTVPNQALLLPKGESDQSRIRPGARRYDHELTTRARPVGHRIPAGLERRRPVPHLFARRFDVQMYATGGNLPGMTIRPQEIVANRSLNSVSGYVSRAAVTYGSSPIWNNVRCP